MEQNITVETAAGKQNTRFLFKYPKERFFPFNYYKVSADCFIFEHIITAMS